MFSQLIQMKVCHQLQSSQQFYQMNKYYTKEDEDKFVEELKSRTTTLKSLENSSISYAKSRSLSKPAQLQSKGSEQMVKHRFDCHLLTVKQQIQNLEYQCNKFGGIDFIKNEMDKNQMGKTQYVDYCMSRISKRFQLPVIQKRSYSQRALRPHQDDKKSKLKYNKWYINPSQRFSKSKEVTKYEWNNEAFIFNIIQKKNQVIQSRFLPDFIAKSKQKINRQPLFCKYTIVKKVI